MALPRTTHEDTPQAFCKTAWSCLAESDRRRGFQALLPCPCPREVKTCPRRGLRLRSEPRQPGSDPNIRPFAADWPVGERRAVHTTERVSAAEGTVSMHTVTRAQVKNVKERDRLLVGVVPAFRGSLDSAELQ